MSATAPGRQRNARASVRAAVVPALTDPPACSRTTSPEYPLHSGPIARPRRHHRRLPHPRHQPPRPPPHRPHPHPPGRGTARQLPPMATARLRPAHRRLDRPRPTPARHLPPLPGRPARPGLRKTGSPPGPRKLRVRPQAESHRACHAAAALLRRRRGWQRHSASGWLAASRAQVIGTSSPAVPAEPSPPRQDRTGWRRASAGALGCQARVSRSSRAGVSRGCVLPRCA